MTRRLPFLLLLLIFVASTTAKDIPGFWTIDCGGTGFEAKNNITWVSDDGFVRTGVSREGQNGTLRAFPSKKYKKNCYTIPVEKGVKILVRVYFYYGDYDGLGSPPEMQLIFDGYDWGPLQTSTRGEGVEVIYITKRNGTNICFGRTSANQDPFVSIIKVRTLGLSSYTGGNDSIVLGFWRRDAFGADGVIQYPDDIYDRTWYPRSDGFTVLRSDTNYTNTTSWPTDDNPPPLLTRTAVGPLNGSSPKLSISLSDLPTHTISIYYNIYFSEMSNRTTHGTRAFNLFRDGIQRTNERIIPPYQSLVEYYGSGVEATNSTTFEFVSTGNATLPPIISGMEIYGIEDAGGATSENDVVALGNLQERFQILQEWTGDPCLPENYNWEWIRCVFDNPRVNKLTLSGFGLSGKLPDFTDLDQLVVIDLHNNSLNGPIPEFFNNFQNLTVLNLADNKFTSIPDSLLHNKKIKLDISGNPISLPPPSPRGKDGSPPPAPKNEGRKAKVPDQLILSLVILLLVILF